MISAADSAMRSSRLALIAMAVVGLAFAATHGAAIFTDRVNWDEFMLMHRGDLAARFHLLDGGGRPGLGVIAMVPFVSDCSDPMDTITCARLLWAAVTFGMLAGLFFLLREVLGRAPHATVAAALGVSSLVLVPVFLRWSLQVRTDQPAIAFALWGGFLLGRSRTRSVHALIGGVLVGVGYLFSQKAVYVTGLAGLLVVSSQLVAQDIALRRDGKRAALFVAGVLTPVIAYTIAIPLMYVSASPSTIERGMATFAYYRSYLGFRVYASMVPTLYPHILIALLLAVSTVIAYSRRSTHRRQLLAAISIATAGIGIGRFHAAAFPYFWMTLGLFAAAAVAVAWPGIRATLGRVGIVAVGSAWLWMVWIAIPYTHELLTQTQAPQRDAFAFIQRNLPPSARGFHADGGLFCRNDPAPLPPIVRESIVTRFFGPNGAEHSKRFIDELRNRPVSFLLTPRLETFPAVVREFIDAHYVLYSGAVELAGFRVPAGAAHVVDVIAPGSYRWYGDGPLTIGSASYARGATIELASGSVQVSNSGPMGVLTLATSDPPMPSRGDFHSIGQAAEIIGNRRW